MASRTKENILKAALEVFAEKGEHGTRMEEIALRAKANKAMVYYYYNSRENLYYEVLKTILCKLFTTVGDRIDEVMENSDDPMEQIAEISRTYSRLFMENQSWFRIMLEALSGKTDHISRIVREFVAEGVVLPVKFQKILENGIKKGKFRKIDFGHFINAFMGLHLSFYVIRPIFTTFMEFDEEEQREFLKQRETIIPDILFYGIAEKGAAK
ncbi:TetR/AcrR family transcriptional regulator [candidate division KSB1 bacterium]